MREAIPGLVTAMMPAYNAAANIQAAVESIVAQTYSHWELIVVNDGSSDSTAAVVARFGDSRIRVVSLGQNRGRGFARNEVLRRAKGQFVAVCDSDDISLPNRFEQQVAFLVAHPTIGVVSSQVLYFGENEAPHLSMVYPETPDEIDRRFARGRSAVPNQAAMIRSSLFATYGSYREEFRRAQDLEFFLRLPPGSFQTLSEPLVLYRQGASEFSFRYFRENSLYTRYACTRAALRAQSRPVPPIGRYKRRPRVRLALATSDTARFAYVVWRRRRRDPFALRK